jgi:hypothetical protein
VAIEDEFHVLFYCVAYEDYRKLFIETDILSARNYYNFVRLISCADVNIVVKLANFDSCIFKVREQLI